VGKWIAVAVVLLVGLAWLLLGPILRICNEQIQSGMLLLAAAVAAWYAVETWRMADAAGTSAQAAQRQAQATWRSLALSHGTELFAWRVAGADGEEALSVYRILNGGRGYALNVAVHPLWDDWTAQAAGGARALGLSDDWNPPSGVYAFLPPNRSFALPVMPGGRWGFVTVSGREQTDDVLCLRWDDPGRQMRRWRCWRIVVREGPDGGTIKEAFRLNAPTLRCKERCPERVALGRCPREWRHEDETRFDVEVASRWFGTEPEP